MSRIPDWLAEVSKRNEEFSWISYFIVQLDGQPIGFALYYDWRDAKEKWYDIEAKGETYSIDYLIGETYYISKGKGNDTIANGKNQTKQYSKKYYSSA